MQKLNTGVVLFFLHPSFLVGIYHFQIIVENIIREVIWLRNKVIDPSQSLHVSTSFSEGIVFALKYAAAAADSFLSSTPRFHFLPPFLALQGLLIFFFL